MSAAITSTATHLPGQFFEISRALQAAELALPEATRPNNITIAVDTEAGSVTISATVPVVLGGSGGVISYTASDYLV